MQKHANTVMFGYNEPHGTGKSSSLYPKFVINDLKKINTYFHKLNYVFQDATFKSITKI